MLRGKGAMKEIRPQTFLRPDFLLINLLSTHGYKDDHAGEADH